MKKIIKKIHTKKILVIALLFMMVTLSFVGASTKGKKIFDDDSIHSSNMVFQPLNPAVVQISLSQPSILGKLIDHGLAIIDVGDTWVNLLASTEELMWLQEKNLNPMILFEDYAEMMGWKYNPELLLQFHSYSQMTDELQDIADTYPSIAELYDLGSSVQGRTIWGLKITDNPTVEENEPEVRICGCHHGNEFMSVELPLLLAWHLVDNYVSDPDIQDLVDNRETWIIPMVNPDGREASSRYNAHGVDLNRDYGYMWAGSGGSPSSFSQPETQSIRDHALDNNFVLSLSFHTSGDIVNYIWNYKGTPVADHDVVVILSQQYGSHNGYWVVEGYDWYQTRGDTNDFSYGCRGDIDWTIEVQNYNIPQAWDFNRDAMLEIIDAADMGLTGIVTDAYTGEPLAATVWVEEAYWPCFTDPKVGDYHRVLLPGTYNVHYQANGYEEEVFTVEVTDSDEPTVLDVSLNPSNNFYAYQVTWCNFYDPYSYPNNFQNNPTEAIFALGPPDDISASLGVGGTIVLDMSKEGKIFNYEDAPDFKIFEGDTTKDGYFVYVSSNWDGPWTYMGLAIETTEFDLADVYTESAQYIKIIDDGNGNPNEMNPGVDIDAVQNLVPSSNPPNLPTITGPTGGAVGTEYEYTFVTTDPDEDNVSYYIEWGDDQVEEWIGPYASGEEVIVSHTWSEQGTYTIRAKAKDIYGVESEWSEPLTVTISNPPDAPNIDGPTSGIVGVDYEYTFSISDPDGDSMYIRVDWGSGVTGKWFGPFASGTNVRFNYTWDEKGTFTIRAQTQDIGGLESDWAELEVIMPRNKQYSITPFLNFLQSHPNLFPILQLLLQRLGL